MAEDGGGQPGKNECILDAGGGVDMERLKERVESWSKTLSSQESTHKELETGSKQFYELILAVWSLDTAFAVDAAELVCNTLRSVILISIGIASWNHGLIFCCSE